MAPERPQPSNKLQQLFPNTKLPVIISAPMLAVSNGTLAAQVSKAGGFGTVQGGYDLSPGSAHLASLEEDLKTARAALGLTEMTLTPAPVGVGFITYHESVRRFRETALPILEKYLPQAVWLFAPDPDAAGGRAHPGIIEVLHEHGIKVFVQVGTVAAAREAARDGADIIVAQGADAGGHQFAAAAGVVSLVPEVRAMLDEEFGGREIALVAAGGIADPSAVVAAIALGADGVVMGTKVHDLMFIVKFIVAKESSAPEYRRKAILEGKDGGNTTVKTWEYRPNETDPGRTTFHDDILGTSVWPKTYDGRAILTDSYRDHAAGLSLEENRAKFGAAKDAGDDSRQVTWSGTGVGLVKDAIPAADIVRNTQEAAKQRLQALRFAFDDEGKDPKEKSWIKDLGHTLYKHK
ncbi:Nitronate monooxygenase [Cytospora mali]|uniref:Nitronate monooxygenase n=1 Tax=Cytospora mali TaxID=578113 RepID=A0A194WD13_CYTMA|nr:Nitronate monooxygenase [Valsa mali]